MFQSTALHRDGHEIAIELALSSLGLHGDCALLLATVRDVAERQRAQEERLRRLREEAIRAQTEAALSDARIALTARDEFLSVASHELRTPLTALNGYLELAIRRLRNANTVEAERLVRRAHGQTDRLTRLVYDLLDVSRIAGGAFVIGAEPVALSTLVRGVVDQENAAAGSRHEIVLEMPQPLPIIIADGARLEQALVNLIQNAVKYSPLGAPVRVAAWSEPNGLRVEVQDEGTGIAEEEQHRIFERFTRAGNVDPGVSGMGLGLHITREIIEAHGGTIRLTSALGVGSTFFIELPSAVISQEVRS